MKTFVIHCGGMPFNGNTIKERSLGGSETSAYYLARELVKKGKSVILFTRDQNEGVYDGVRYLFSGNETEKTPLGDRFHTFTENTPVDVLIIQRHPLAFRHKYASKINILWCHDLAINRQKDIFMNQLWNVDGILTVSEFHKKQMCEVYGLNKDFVFPVLNGVDLSLFKKREGFNKDGKINLLYTSRPERGLENLVRPGGIMEKLKETGKPYHLRVCNYENVTPQMEGYYNYLYSRIDELDNCENVGHLNKQALADLMVESDVLLYPTMFEEVSCITAMEAMSAGLPFISSKWAALPETCKDSGSILIDTIDGNINIDKFISRLQSLSNMPELMDKQLKAAKKFDWSGNVINVFLETIEKIKPRSSNNSIAKELMANSDIYALRQFVGGKDVSESIKAELDECYKFDVEGKYKDHYEQYYEYEKQRGVNYGPESLSGNHRFERVSSIISTLPSGSSIIDYGCAHGHYTINLAKRFPQYNFVGVDLAESNIAKAIAWKEQEGISNARFFTVSDFESERIQAADSVIAAEVIEHVGDYKELIAKLETTYLKKDGLMIITTPLGPWESQGYKEHWPWRAHLHHFERQDLKDMFQHKKDFGIFVVSGMHDKFANLLGSYVTTYTNDSPGVIGSIDYDYKLNNIIPTQTLSVCMIVKNGQLTLEKCLKSVSEVADEIIIAIDETTSDKTEEIARQYAKSLSNQDSVFKIPSPTVIGFDEARNRSIERASGEWIMWIDSDEEFFGAENIKKYLRNNMYNGYAIKQHHYSVSPPCLLKTDLPVRIFRNNKGIRFFGVVHEHPEIELNEGIGMATLLHDVDISHPGYATEDIRRGRFQRNIGLMFRDRKTYPSRILGRFLWLRDLAQMCQFELENNGNQITPEMHTRAYEGIKIWRELVEEGQIRMALDGLQFYTMLVKILGTGFDFAFKFDSSKLNGGVHMQQAPEISGTFFKREDVDILVKKLIDEKTKDYDSRYY